MPQVLVETPADLDPAAVLAVADGVEVVLSSGLTDALTVSRAATEQALASAGPVYGVTTGMGNQAHLSIGADEQPAFQDHLMLARSVGTAPWLDRREVRAVLATRLRTLLEPEVGVSPDLARAIAAVLTAGLHPAVPTAGNGAAGEIIPLAHLGAFLTGRGEGLDHSGRSRPAGPLLRDAGMSPYSFAAKEGVAFLQGVPVATALGVLLGSAARLLATQVTVVASAEVALVRAPRDPYAAALARGDDELAVVLEAIRSLAGDEPAPHLLQAPVSFRVVGPALAVLHRAVRSLDQSVGRALTGVSTSPALVGGRFLGTAGFHGFDLAAAADAVRLAVLHVAELGAARLHRLLDPRVTGLPAQLSLEPGRQAGLVALHKRAVGLVHEARRTSAPAALGATETSLGHEDAQGFAVEAARAALGSLEVLRDVTACELLAVHQAQLLDPAPRRGSEALNLVLHHAFRVLPDRADDRPTGRDVAAIVAALGIGWADHVLPSERDQPSSADVPRS
ncbi:MAG TPA: aromatic amino acid lyase [Nocardioidaceae bacterium]|nr:aromatic amino acid lyase [Nocardioidaceae bacterium]